MLHNIIVQTSCDFYFSGKTLLGKINSEKA